MGIMFINKYDLTFKYKFGFQLCQKKKMNNNKALYNI